MQSKENDTRYQQRGVSASKKEVHDAIENIDPGLFPKAFCKITPDYLTKNPEYCNLIHADGSGTKSILAYLKYRETGDPSVFQGIAQDSIVMNIDDLLCVGITDGILISSTINRNAKNFPGSALAELIKGNESFLAKLREWGIGIYSGGGETADMGDLTGSVTVDSCATAVAKRSDIITGENIVPGLAIIGIASYGKATYEDLENSGIGSNGLTSARHDLLCKHYRERYPETWDPNMPEELAYCGPYRLDDALPDSNMSVGEAILSPTRTYAPIIKKLLDKFRPDIRGIIHCSGGAQSKCLRFGNKVHFVKENWLPIPPLFMAIHKASNTTWREMFQVYNMGHRMEIYCPQEAADKIIESIHHFKVDAQIIGHTEVSQKADEANHLSVHYDGEVYTYE